MAANGRGYMRPNSGGRTPSFLIIGLLVVITILAFNYWNVSSRNSELSMTMDEVQLKYRSTQAKKLDVERRNSELSAQLDDAKKYRQEAQEKAIRLREAEQKEKELIAKIDNLASEMEVVKSDLNTCDDEVGFCHENITKMIIAHKKALEEAQINCNMKIDAAKSNAEQRAASVESSCHQAVNEMRLMILRMVQEVFGTKAILLLQQQVHTDVSGIDLNKVTGPDVQMAQQPQQHNEHHIQQSAEEQQVVQNQQEQQHELQQPVQGQPQPVQGQQQPVQGQQQPAQSQQWPVQGQQEPGQGQQQPDLGQQQPDLGQQQPVQGQQQQVQGQQQPGQLQQQPVQEQQQQQLQEQDQNQLQQAVHEQQQPQVQQPQIQQPLHEQQQKQQEPQQQASNQDELPSEHLTEVREQHQGGLNEEKQEAIARSGLLQTDDLVKAAQRGYNQAVSERDVDVQSHVGNVQLHGYVTDNRELNDKPLQEHRADDNQAIINQAPVAQQGIEQKTFDQGVQTAVGQEMARNDGYRSENVAQREAFHHVATNEAAAAPAGQVMIEDGLNREHDNMAQSDRDNTRLDLGQRRDQADYLPAEIDRTAPIGQADESHVDVPQFHEYRDEKHQAVRDLQEDEEFIEHIPQQ